MTKPPWIVRLQLGLRALNIPLSVVALLCFVFTISIALVTKDGAASGLISLSTNVSYSIIAAFIFYLILDLFPRVRSVLSLMPHVSRQIHLISSDASAICREAARLHGTPLADEWQFDESEVRRLFSGFGTNTEAQLVTQGGGNADFMAYLVLHADRTERWLGNLVQIAPFLGADGMALVSAIKEGSYLNMVRATSAARAWGPIDVAFYAEAFIGHSRALASLESWAASRGLYVEGVGIQPLS